MSDPIGRFARSVGNWIPDAAASAAAMLLVLAVSAKALGDDTTAVIDAWYRGLWMLLPFSMQMTLILVLSAVVGETAAFRRIVLGLARVPRNTTQVLALSVLLTSALSYLYWGLGITLGPLVAVHFARAAEERGIAIDFPFLLAVQSAAVSVWQYGLSSSAPLLVATSGHFLEATTGVMPLDTTIWSGAAIAVVVVFPIALVAMARAIAPRDVQPISAFPESVALTRIAEPERADAASAGLSGWSERTVLFPLLLAAALALWLHHHFVTKGAALDFNAMNTILLLAALLLHRRIASFSAALRRGVASCWSILVLYQLYGGVAGLLQYTSVGTEFAEIVAGAATRGTFPLLTALAGTLVAIFVPSSGGQWVVQGFVTATAAEAVGVAPARALLALGVGDQMGNLLSPFWVVVIAGIARVEFRRIYGYGLLFAVLWFVVGVAAFTWMP